MKKSKVETFPLTLPCNWICLKVEVQRMFSFLSHRPFAALIRDTEYSARPLAANFGLRISDCGLN